LFDEKHVQNRLDLLDTNCRSIRNNNLEKDKLRYECHEEDHVHVRWNQRIIGDVYQNDDIIPENIESKDVGLF